MPDSYTRENTQVDKASTSHFQGYQNSTEYEIAILCDEVYLKFHSLCNTQNWAKEKRETPWRKKILAWIIFR